ncbi:MAG TPA: hypothetical protein VFA18_22025 [Gemmataceae bacterium]|nr:hypothetical protein [Gemmataceae bacterium]
MRLTILASFLASTAAFTLLTPSAIPAEHLSKNRAEQLVSQLGSRHFGEREAASRALDALGAGALPALRAALHSEDLEVRRRAGDLAQQISKRLERDRLLAAPRVHLVFQDCPVKTALEELNKKTHLHVDFRGDDAALTDRRLTLDTGRVSVWEALEQFCGKAGLSEATPRSSEVGRAMASRSAFEGDVIMRGGGVVYATRYRNQPMSRPSLVLVDGPGKPLPTVQMGAVRIRALPPNVGVAGRRFNATDKVLALEVRADPRLQCERVLRVRIDHAVDEHAEILSQVTHANNRYIQRAVIGGRIYSRGYNPSRMDAQYVPFSLAPAKQKSTQLKELRGLLSVEVQTPPEDLLTVDHILKAGGKQKASAGVELKVLAVERRLDGQVKVRVQLTTPILDGTEFRRAAFMRRRMLRAGLGDAAADEGEESPLILVDGKGKHFAQVGSPQFFAISTNMGGTLTQEMELTYRPQPKQGAAARLIYRAPRHVAIDVPFTFHHVPLP